MTTDLQYSYSVHKRPPVSSVQRGLVLWYVGLSGSGKSTYCDRLSLRLLDSQIRFVILDGDTFRCTISRDLGFSENDRSENLRRAAHVAKLFCEQGFVVLCSFITPLEQNREMIKQIVGDSYFEVYVDTPLASCIERDPKGLYKKALKGEILNFTGISSSFEPPAQPDFTLLSNESLDSNVNSLFKKIMEKIK